MSTGLEPTRTPEPWAIALTHEMRRFGLARESRADDDEPVDPVVTEDELAAMANGQLTRSEENRLLRLMILEMIGHAMPLREIRRRLQMPRSRFDHLVTGVLHSGMGEDKVDEMRAIVNAAFSWSITEATREYKLAHTTTDKMACLRQRSADLCNQAKLNGLNKPEQIEVRDLKSSI